MKSMALIPLLAASLAFAEGIIVKNGGGFAEFLMARTHAELADRWEETVRTQACPGVVAQTLATAAVNWRRRPSQIRFAEPADMQRLSREPGVLASRFAPILVQGDVLWIDHAASLPWTDEATALSVVTDAELLRQGGTDPIRSQAVNCLRARSRLRFVSVDLKSYRQPAVGALVGQDGRMWVTDSEAPRDLGLSLTGCGPRPIESITTTALQGQGPQLRWVLNLKTAPACAPRLGRALVVTLDFALANGDANAFLGGNRLVRLKLIRQNVQSVR